MWDLSTQECVCQRNGGKTPFNSVSFLFFLSRSIYAFWEEQSLQRLTADLIYRTYFYVKKIINRFVPIYSFIFIDNIQIWVGTFCIFCTKYRIKTDQTLKSFEYISFHLKFVLFIRSSKPFWPSWFILLFCCVCTHTFAFKVEKGEGKVRSHQIYTIKIIKIVSDFKWPLHHFHQIKRNELTQCHSLSLCLFDSVSWNISFFFSLCVCLIFAFCR